ATSSSCAPVSRTGAPSASATELARNWAAWSSAEASSTTVAEVKNLVLLSRAAWAALVPVKRALPFFGSCATAAGCGSGGGEVGPGSTVVVPVQPVRRRAAAASPAQAERMRNEAPNRTGRRQVRTPYGPLT